MTKFARNRRKVTRLLKHELEGSWSSTNTHAYFIHSKTHMVCKYDWRYNYTFLPTVTINRETGAQTLNGCKTVDEFNKAHGLDWS